MNTHCLPDPAKVRTRRLIRVMSFWVLLAGLAGCETSPTNPTPTPTPDPNDNDPTARAADCLGCHTNETMLKLVAREEPAPVEESGEG